MPLSAAHPKPVEIDQFLDMFDQPTRQAIQENLVGFGNALAGRGPRPERCVRRPPPRWSPAPSRSPRNLAAPSTGASAASSARSRPVAAEVAPVAETQAQHVRRPRPHLRRLRRASRAPSSRRRSPRRPPTLDTLTPTCRAIRPFLGHSATLLRRPSARGARRSARPRRRSPQRCEPASRSCPTPRRAQRPAAADRADAAGVLPGRPDVIDRLNRSTDTYELLNPTLRFIDPGADGLQLRDARCSATSPARSASGDGIGTGQRFIAIGRQRPVQGTPNSENGPASAPAERGDPNDRDNFLHSNPYPNTASPGQPHECEAGNENYIAGQIDDRQPARQPGHHNRGQTADEPAASKADGPREARPDRSRARRADLRASVPRPEPGDDRRSWWRSCPR